MLTWGRINEDKVVNVWKCSPEKGCDCPDPIEVEVNPDWYEQNGTPVCACGTDMAYAYTKVFMEHPKR